MKQITRPNYRQERTDFEHYQQSNSKKPWCFPFKIAFEKLKNLNGKTKSS